MSENNHIVEQLSKLSRIRCTPEEAAKLEKALLRVLGYIKQLEEIDTAGVPPCNHVLEGMINVEREDTIGTLLSRETFLKNSPEQVAGMIRVPTIIKGKQ